MDNQRFYGIKWLTMITLLGVYVMVFNLFMDMHLAPGIIGFGHEQLIRIRIVSCYLYIFLYFILLNYLEALMIGQKRILDLIFGQMMAAGICNLTCALIAWILVLMDWKTLIVVAIFTTIIQTLVGVVWIIFMHRIYEHYYFVNKSLFIYGSRDNPVAVQSMQATIKRFFHVSEHLSYTEGMEILQTHIRDNKIIFLGDVPTQMRNELLKFCLQEKIECYCVSKISDIYIHSSEIRQLHDKLLLKFPSIEILDSERMVKRVLDIVMSLITLIVTLPFMVLIAIAIKLTDGGPIMYKQERVTRNGEKFEILKFRSMCIDAEKKGAMLAKKNDKRITWIGKIIRNIHFDELPQLINILRGEMSFVGPRPEREQFIKEYSQIVPEFSERLKVKAGLTGYAQVYGKYNTDPYDKVKYDLHYIYNYSFWLDIKLIILTVRILFQAENTEGVDEWQNSALYCMQSGEIQGNGMNGK